MGNTLKNKGIIQRYKVDKPEDIIQRYKVEKTDRTPIDPNAEYFVLRLDAGGSDKIHVNACRVAVLAYADAIEEHLPILSQELRGKYSEKID